jgi:hypothetical protein
MKGSGTNFRFAVGRTATPRINHAVSTAFQIAGAVCMFAKFAEIELAFVDAVE